MSLKSYYLQQMGIETWVRRNVLPHVSGVHLIAPKRAESLALIVFEGGEFDESSEWVAGTIGQLLKNMLQSIGLSSENAAVLFGDPSQMNDVVQAHVVRLKPRVIVVLEKTSSTCGGLQLGSLSPTYKAQIVNSIHPIDLLNQPSRKKSAYSALWQAQKHFSPEPLVML